MRALLLDIYRFVLLGELVFVELLYVWSLWKYLTSSRHIKEPSLRALRAGVTSRVFGIEVILVLFTLAVISRLGSDDVGRLLYNIMLQVGLLFFFMAWGLVDRRRFYHLEEEPVEDIALRAIERVEQVRAEHEAKRPPHERRRRATDMPT